MILPSRLYAIVDAGATTGRRSVALAGGAPAPAARACCSCAGRRSAPRTFLAAAGECREPDGTPGARLLINDRVDVALACRRRRRAPRAGRPAVGGRAPAARPRPLIGVSTHNVAQARAAAAGGADYLGFGPIFATTTKRTGYPPRGLRGAARRASRGVAADRRHRRHRPRQRAEVLAAGADAVAMIAALAAAPDAAAAARDRARAARPAARSP